MFNLIVRDTQQYLELFIFVEQTELLWIELFLHLAVCKQKTVLMLNWIVWNIKVYMYKMDLALITYNGWCAIKPNQIKPNHLTDLGRQREISHKRRKM